MRITVIKSDAETIRFDSFHFLGYHWSVIHLVKASQADAWATAFGPRKHMAMQFTDANFDAEVLKSDKPVLVDFWAPWCGPCQMMGPVIDALAEEMTTAKIGKLNVDENPATASAYGIMSIPTLKAFKGGQVVKEWMGAQSKDKLKEEMASL